MILYGRHPVREAIRGPRAIHRLWAVAGVAREPWLTAAPARVEVVAADEIERRCGSPEHQGLCAEVDPFRYADESALLAAADPLIVALDQVQDPHHLGAVCRTAECAGASALVIPERRAAEITPAVAKAAAGAIEHLPIVRVRNLADFLAAAKRAGLWCYGAAPAAETRYDSVDYAGGVVLVLGSEGRGLRPRVADACDLLVAIPMRGQIESLSVSAAAAVLLYEAAGRRG